METTFYVGLQINLHCDNEYCGSRFFVVSHAVLPCTCDNATVFLLEVVSQVGDLPEAHDEDTEHHHNLNPK